VSDFALSTPELAEEMDAMTPDPASIEAELRKRHSAEYRGRAVCATCGISEPWPCDAIRAADALESALREIARLREHSKTDCEQIRTAWEAVRPAEEDFRTLAQHID
jgi:hypothetical protein